jgi:hypothetical protein
MKEAGAPPFVHGERLRQPGRDHPHRAVRPAGDGHALARRDQGLLHAARPRRSPARPSAWTCLAPEGYGRDHRRQPAHPRPRLLLQRIQEHGLPIEAFQWYLEIRKYGTVRTPASAWGSSAASPGSAGSRTCARPSPTRGRSTASTVSETRQDPGGAWSASAAPRTSWTPRSCSGHLDAEGRRFVTEPEEADGLLVNTCAFIGEPRESVRAILDAPSSSDGEAASAGGAGCMGQRYRRAGEKPSRGDGFLGLTSCTEVTPAVRSDVPLFTARPAPAGDLSSTGPRPRAPVPLPPGRPT